MASKTKTGLDPQDPKLPKEDKAISVDLEIQELSSDISKLENIEEVDKKTINYMEQRARKSYEYMQYINYLKSELDITKCALTPGLDIKELSFSLEFHHYPITLFDIVQTISNKLLCERKADEKVSMFDIMELVMKEHYEGNIGLVPLSTTYHEMVHNGSIIIPYSAIYGNYDNFEAKYKKYMSPELKDKIQTARTITDEKAKEFNTKMKELVLQYNIQYNENKLKKKDNSNPKDLSDIY